jgi:hypothetical protein
MNRRRASELGLSQPDSARLKKIASRPFRKQLDFTGPKGDPFCRTLARLPGILTLQIPGEPPIAVRTSFSDVPPVNQGVKG